MVTKGQTTHTICTVNCDAILRFILAFDPVENDVESHKVGEKCQAKKVLNFAWLIVSSQPVLVHSKTIQAVFFSLTKRHSGLTPKIADGKHGIWHRTSTDLLKFSESSLVMTGGQAGKNWWNFECPHVVHHEGMLYLFHTQTYGPGKQQTSVYHSTDPTHFGINDDSQFMTHLPVAAPEILHHDGIYYLAALTPELDGIRITRLDWE